MLIERLFKYSLFLFGILSMNSYGNIVTCATKGDDLSYMLNLYNLNSSFLQENVIYEDPEQNYFEAFLIRSQNDLLKISICTEGKVEEFDYVSFCLIDQSPYFVKGDVFEHAFGGNDFFVFNFVKNASYTPPTPATLLNLDYFLMITEINNKGFTIDDFVVGAGARVKKTKYTNWANYPGCLK